MSTVAMAPHPLYSRTTLEADDLREVLPHRPPFLLLDRVTQVEWDSHAVGVKNVGIGEPCFAGHFPHTYVYPGVLIVESLAQLAGVVRSRTATAGGTRPPRAYLAAVRGFKFTGMVRPGDRLLLEARAGSSVNGITDFTVSARVDGAVVAAGRIAIAETAEGES